MKTHRIKNVEEYILKNESVSLDKLCDVFKVSKNTLRRDIKALLEKRKNKENIRRSYDKPEETGSI